MESKIHTAETNREKAREALLDPTIATNAQELMERQKAVDDLTQKIESLYARWTDLESR
jgi:hypothetical protein